MAVTVTVNGTGYTIPNRADEAWGENVTSWIQAVTAGVLQKAGGAFTLTAEADFGATYGLKSAYFTTRTASPASAGPVRLANDEGVTWRNAADDGDIVLKADGSDDLDFGGETIATQTWVTSQIATKDTFLEMNDTPGSYTSQANKLPAVNSGETALEFIEIANANVASAAAIAFSKMENLTASRALVSNGSGDVSVSAVTATQIGYLSNLSQDVQASLDGKQPSDGDLTAIAAIVSNGILVRTTTNVWALRQLVAGSNRIGITNADGQAGNPTINVNEANLTHDNIGGTLGIAKGGTGQTTLADVRDTVIPTTTKGDILTRSSSAHVRLPVGADGQVLTADSGETSGLGWSSPLTNPMTTQGDIIIGGSSGAATRLAGATDNRVLAGNGTTVEFKQIDDPAFFASGAAATDSAAGTLSYYQTTSFTADGDFTGGTVYVTRIGNVVTVSTTNLTHGSNGGPTDGAAIPSWARPPTDTVRNTFNDGSGSYVGMIEVATNGNLTVRYYSGMGSVTSRTSMGVGASVSYVVT